MLTVLVGLVAGGLSGVGVSQGWYGPAIGVGAAALIGLAVGSQVFRLRRQTCGRQHPDPSQSL